MRVCCIENDYRAKNRPFGFVLDILRERFAKHIFCSDVRWVIFQVAVYTEKICSLFNTYLSLQVSVWGVDCEQEGRMYGLFFHFTNYVVFFSALKSRIIPCIKFK